MNQDPVIWQPSKSVINKANVTKFMKKHDIATYDDLISRCNSGIEWFWDVCVQETGIEWFEPYMHIANPSKGFPFTKWFEGGKINIAHNCLDRHVQNKSQANKTAVIWQGECGATKKISYAELFAQTNQVANYLLSIGIQKGDCVALYVPMISELIPIFYACLKIGAVIVPIFSGFGTDSVLVRFEEAKVKAVFTADGTLRGGKPVYLKKMLDEALDKSSTVQKCIVIRRLFEDAVPMHSERDVFYDQVIENQNQQLSSLELDSEDLSLIIFTSGTTGKPKGTIHTHAGVLAQVTKEFYFHFDFKPGEVFFWVTDIGWMMGPWEIIGTHHFGGTLVLLEGAPYYPQTNRVLKLCKDVDVTHLGVSPTLIRFLMKENVKTLPLPKLRIMGSTGEPWDPDSYMWCFDKIGKSQVPIMNISGGTELMGCLLAPLPIKELKACSLQGPGLGMAVDIYDDLGNSQPQGEVGYLVCKKPAPSMTKSFLNDTERYLETYFSKFPNTWNHGDWAVCDADGHWFLRGRSDDTIKIAGKRTGPAEIESVLCDHPFVSEACAVGVPDTLKGQALVCFVVLKNKIHQTDFLIKNLKKCIVHKLGKVMNPKSLYIVEGLAKTRSGKIVRGTIKKQYLGQDVGNLSSLDNPKLLDCIPSHI